MTAYALEGAGVLVTGGGTGIGRACAARPTGDGAVNTPFGGATEPDEVASVVSFLLGPDSARVTGQAIAIDGGHHLRAGPDFRSFSGLSRDQLLGRQPPPA